jgi:hypothetical protein
MLVAHVELHARVGGRDHEFFGDERLPAGWAFACGMAMDERKRNAAIAAVFIGRPL